MREDNDRLIPGFVPLSLLGIIVMRLRQNKNKVKLNLQKVLKISYQL